MHRTTGFPSGPQPARRITPEGRDFYTGSRAGPIQAVYRKMLSESCFLILFKLKYHCNIFSEKGSSIPWIWTTPFCRLYLEMVLPKPCIASGQHFLFKAGNVIIGSDHNQNIIFLNDFLGSRGYNQFILPFYGDNCNSESCPDIQINN